MQVLISKYAGFCPGVQRAVKITLQHGKGKPGKVATYGPLVHNAQMIDYLADKKQSGGTGERGDRHHGYRPLLLPL